MFSLENDKTINVTRGDTAYFAVTANDPETEESYTFQAGDVVRFTVYEKNNAENVFLKKDFLITTPSEEVIIFLDDVDTRFGDIISKPKVYWYEVELNPGTMSLTIIGYDEDGAKVFRLYPEGNVVDDEEIKQLPEGAVIDSELDALSDNAVANKAVAKAIIALDNELKNVRNLAQRLEATINAM